MAVKVNGDIIPEQAIEFELSRLIRFYSGHMDASQVRKQMDVLKERAKQQAIGAKLLIDEARKLDLQVPDDLVDKQLQQMIDEAGGEAAFGEIIKKQGLTLDHVRENVREGRRVDMLVEKLTEGIDDPTEAEMEQHFEAHESEYTAPPRAQAQHILVGFEKDDEEARKEAHSKVKAIRQRIADGSDFSEEASEHSDCPSGKQAGGSLGWFSPGMMVPEFDAAVFSMSVDELSDVIETDFGFHVVRKTGEEAEREASFDEVRDRVRDFLRHSRRGEILSSCVNELRQKATIEED